MTDADSADPLDATFTTSASSSRSGSPAPSLSSAVKMRRTSHESLAAHPLSSDDNDNHSTNHGASDLSEAGISIESPSAKPTLVKGTSSYTVYKPRQRPSSVGNAPSVAKSPPPFNPSAQLAVATTSTSLTATSTEAVTASPKSPTSVTAKLQLQSLQATAQSAGLSSESAGWQIIQKLVADHDKQRDPGWTTIYTALRSGKTALLLPKESAAMSEITPKLLLDHLVVKDGVSVATLSGLRGVKAQESITFSACVSGPDTKATDVTEASILSLLGTSPPALLGDDASAVVNIGRQIELHIPRASANPGSPKPVKPGKPRTLASLFGGNRGTALSSSASKPAADSADSALPPAAAPTLTGTGGIASAAAMTVAAWPTENIVSGKKIAKAVERNLESKTRALLASDDIRLADMTIAFFKRFNAVYTASGIPSVQHVEPAEKEANGKGSLLTASIDDITSAIQEFFYDVQLRLEQLEYERLALAEAMAEGNEKEKPIDGTPKRADEILGKVEAFVCDMLYDRLFSPVQASDRQDDESLSTRIAGLHMLDLTLDHLGFRLDASNSSPDEANDRRVLQDGIDEIIKNCETELQKLQKPDCRTPSAKLDVLVQVHKIIADALGQLPPIPMKEDIVSPDLQAGTTSGRHVAQAIEMSDDAKSLGGRSARAKPSEVQEDKTPRLPASRPASAHDQAVPTLNLPGAAYIEPYPITPTSSAFVDDKGDLSATSYFESRSSAAALAPRKATTTSADAILPLLIYAVVQANPSRLVSHTMFIQRFRADSLMRGEGEYCLTNIDAVKHFLMSCDIASLGLGIDRILTSTDLPVTPRMRHRTAQQLDSMVGSAGKVLGQAADLGLGGYRMLGGLLARNQPGIEGISQPKTIEEVQSVLAGGASRAASFRDSILRRGTVSSVAPSSTSQRKLPEQELADVSGSTEPAIDQGIKAAEAAASPSISSRLASLPGLARLNSSSAAEANSPAARAQPATVTGATQPNRTSLFSAFSLPLVPTGSSTSTSSTEQNKRDALAAPSVPSNRRPTVSAFPPVSDQIVLQEQPSAVSPSLVRTDASSHLSPPGTPGLSERSGPFISHSQHHELLKAETSRNVSRVRSDSGASATSGSKRLAALSAVSNLVSNVRHSYSPSISSLTAKPSDTTSSSESAPAQPIQRFLECEADDLRLSEVVLLLADYKRLALALADLQAGQA